MQNRLLFISFQSRVSTEYGTVTSTSLELEFYIEKNWFHIIFESETQFGIQDPNKNI